MDNQTFKKLNISRKEIEKFLLDENGNIAIRVSLVSSGEAGDVGAVNVDQVGGDAVTLENIIEKDITKVGGDNVPTLGSQKVMPAAIYNDAGDQITSFGVPTQLAVFRSPGHFVATYLSSTMISVTQFKGFAIEEGVQIKYISVQHSDGTVENFFNGVDGISLTYATEAITIVGASPFLSGDKYEVGINANEVDLDLNSQSRLVSVINAGTFAPSSTETRTVDADTETVVEEILLDNIHRNKMIQIETDANVTAKVYRTLNPDASTADLTTGWIEITATRFGGASPIPVSTPVDTVLENEMPDRLAVAVTSASTAGTATINLKQF